MNMTVNIVMLILSDIILRSLASTYHAFWINWFESISTLTIEVFQHIIIFL